MIKLEYLPNYRIYLFEIDNCNLPSDKLDENDIMIYISRKYLLSENYLKTAVYHYFDTIKYKHKWIRDPIYRLLAFILREDQIKNIQERLEKYKKDTILLVTDKEVKTNCREIKLDSDSSALSDLAIFRLKIEKERLL